MKRKTVGILAAGMVMASLAGCGTKAEVISQEVVTEEEPIVVTDENGSDDTTINTENEITETEEVPANEEDDILENTENDEIVLYAEIGESEFIPQSSYTYYTEAGTVTAKEDIPIYNGDGINIGYIKNGAAISVSEKAQEANWCRFENPFDGTEYDYLYVSSKKVVVDGSTISADEMVDEIIAEISQYAFETPVFLDAPTSDMEVHEFRVTNSKEVSWKDGLFRELISINDSIEANLYKTFYIECEEDEDGEPYILCRVYYKDKIEQ